MSDLLAKCDWDGDELRVELPQWPEVVTVWVNGKAMPFAPVVADVRSLQAENDKLRVELTDLSLKSCPSCGIKVENEELRELVAELASFISRADWLQWPELADRMAKLRVEVE